MANHCQYCDTRRPPPTERCPHGTRMLTLGDDFTEFCDPCGDKNTVTNGETGETITLHTLYEREPDAFKKDAFIYVVSFMPGHADDEISTGGFGVFVTPAAARACLERRVVEDPEIQFTLLMRRVKLPRSFRDRSTVMEWLDTEGIHYWTTFLQESE